MPSSPYQVMADGSRRAGDGHQVDFAGRRDRYGDGAGLYDTATGKFLLLIPQGSRIPRTTARSAMGRSRVCGVEPIILPGYAR